MRARIAAWIGACCLVLGLLGMHALAQHGTHAAQQAPAAAAHSALDHPADPSAHLLTGAAHAEPGAASSYSHPAPGAEGCADCAQTHATTTAACLLALLAAALWLAPPRVFRLAAPARRRLSTSFSVFRSATPRPPDLTMLCISRT
ncbi:DUF6153 family protein [Zhihengliuella halotolerans]|uniref:DUF6153 family protein n=1 Tax=Zhihengliuella halotolerans TaxID=370736 RepID=UPI0011AF96F9|nr:DUF6153 family protein [Zhihengliuella halotolerans]